MENKNNLILEYAALVVVVIIALAFFARIKNQDIDFSRRVFAGLVEGKQSAQNLIDWQNLNALGANIGANYLSLSNDRERVDYRNFFIRGFSLNFKKTGAQLWSFTHWRVYDKQDGVVIVAADYTKHNKTILFTISKYPKPKLIGIQWEDKDGDK